MEGEVSRDKGTVATAWRRRGRHGATVDYGAGGRLRGPAKAAQRRNAGSVLRQGEAERKQPGLSGLFLIRLVSSVSVPAIRQTQSEARGKGPIAGPVCRGTQVSLGKGGECIWVEDRDQLARTGERSH